MSVLKESQNLKIPLKEIEIATNNFQMCIGKGGYGEVYKGELLIHGNLTTVAVKRLNERFGQGLKEFLIEIQLLTGQNHPNLITLIGYCDEGKEKIIVYEYAEKGSLDQYLRRSGTEPALNWPERLKICVNAARGLNHLHNDVGKHQTIIHRDIKSANILIDHKWVAKISDLGLSKLSLAGLNRSLVISHACGTPGYCEPEYFSTGVVRKESDVYSFGVVLFEVLCGRLCFIRGDDGFLLSAKSVKNYYKEKKLDEIVDPIIREQTSLALINQFATIAYNCLNDERGERPSMELIAKELEELLKFQLSSHLLETPSKIRSDFELHMSDDTLQARANTSTDPFGLGANLSHLTKLVDGVLIKIKERKLKLAKLVHDCLIAILQISDLNDSLRTCLKRARETWLLIHEAVHHFDDENGLEENRYGKIVDVLKKFKAAGDPFTQDFFRIFSYVYKEQITSIKKLQRKEAKLNEELNQTCMRKWVSLLSKNYKNDNEYKKEVLRRVQGLSNVTVRDLDKIQATVDRLQMDIKNQQMIADFIIKMEDAMEYVIDNIKKQLNPFSESLDELENMATVFDDTFQKARAIIL